MSAVSDADSVRVICGPTATGKSALAMRLARIFTAGIVSADSRQVFRGFNIGTAKPTAADRAAVPHFCVDTVDPALRYTAADWAEDAERAIAACIRAGSVPLIVGGTGFWLRALFRPLFREPDIDPGMLSSLRLHLDELSTDELRRWCRTLDPAVAQRGRAQLARAVEVATLTGERLSVLQAREQRPARRKARYLLVDSGPALRPAIAGRVHEMFAEGWEDEVRELAKHVPATAAAWKATGYRDVLDLVQGRLSREEAMGRIVIATRQYAKRQRTWFRHQLNREDVTRVDGCAPDMFERAVEWWNGGNT